MNCYSHVSVTALASCRSCGRGICQECARDAGHAVVCSEVCETLANHLHALNRRALRVHGIGASKKRLPIAPTIWGAFAMLFIGWGVVSYIEYGGMAWFPILFGMVAGVIAGLIYRRTRELEP